jgi:hypothetical protein
MPIMQDLERLRNIDDKADSAHTLASVTAAQLEYHAAEDQRMFKNINEKIDAISEEIKSINKWIWIATGIMTAVTTTINAFLVYHHG